MNKLLAISDLSAVCRPYVGLQSWIFSDTVSIILGMNKPNSEALSRIKIQRIKRSWTQEHLSEVSNLSVRTIQRIESGAEVSYETIRILAQAFNVDPEELKETSIRNHFSAPWGRKLKITTCTIVTLMILISVIYPVAQYIAASIILICLLLSVRGYSILNNRIVIHRLGWSKSFSLNELTELKIEPNAMVGAVRLWGIGGLFSCVGYYRNSILGTHIVYATDSRNSVILKLGKRKVVITPDSPSDFQNTVLSELKNLQKPN